MLRRVLVVLMSLALVAGLTACGNKKSRITHAETEGVYVDLGKLKYQVQISRPLNAQDAEDKEFLRGVERHAGHAGHLVRGLHARAERVQHVPASRAAVEITDTLNNKFTPVSIDTKANPFAYDPVGIVGKGTMPGPNSICARRRRSTASCCSSRSRVGPGQPAAGAPDPRSARRLPVESATVEPRRLAPLSGASAPR